jgi:protein-L-isoaspartate O-methyltransferase
MERLAATLRAAGHLTPAWEPAFRAARRDLFATDVIWFPRDETAVPLTLQPCDRNSEPKLWSDRVWSVGPVNIQVDDGDPRGPEGSGTGATSGISNALLVFDMLHLLDVRPGQRCLEIGAGAGWNAGLLAARLGDENVVTIDVDPTVADIARANLAQAGLAPLVLTGDGALGHPKGAPYHRVIATCGSRQLPYAWVEQTRPGGVIVAPISFTWRPLTYVARLEVDDSGVASGAFRLPCEFMSLRSQRVFHRELSELLGDQADVEMPGARTMLDPVAVYQQEVLAIYLSAAVPGVEIYHDESDGTVHLGTWQEAPGQGSYALITGCADENGPWTVHQWGPRKLWDETVAAHRFWEEQGFPDYGRFGLTVASPTDHRIWFDAPDGPSWPLPPLASRH